MDEETMRDMRVLRSLKADLIKILSADPDFVLQHAYSRYLLSENGYKQVKALIIPTEQVTGLLDHVINRGSKAAHGLLELLRANVLQENFPGLSFLKNPEVNIHFPIEETSTKRKNTESEENIPIKQSRKDDSSLVTEKQLMQVAQAIGHSWREIGLQALNISYVKLEQIAEDNPHRLVMRAFAMLRHWRCCQKLNATAANLHSLLSQEDLALPPENIDFLLDKS